MPTSTSHDTPRTRHEPRIATIAIVNAHIDMCGPDQTSVRDHGAHRAAPVSRTLHAPTARDTAYVQRLPTELRPNRTANRATLCACTALLSTRRWLCHRHDAIRHHRSRKTHKKQRGATRDTLGVSKTSRWCGSELAPHLKLRHAQAVSAPLPLKPRLRHHHHFFVYDMTP